jgi:fatty acid synthase subunit beta
MRKNIVLFGGQGFDYIRTFTKLYLHDPLLVTENWNIFQPLLDQLMQNAEIQYIHGLNMLEWVGNKKHLPEDYVMSPSVSFPLIGVVQFVAIALSMRDYNATPAAYREAFGSHLICGHSQGLLTSIAIASCSTKVEFIQYAKMMIVVLFWIGCHAQKVWEGTLFYLKILDLK